MGSGGNQKVWRRFAGVVLSVATLASLAVGTAGTANAAEGVASVPQAVASPDGRTSDAAGQTAQSPEQAQVGDGAPAAQPDAAADAGGDGARAAAQVSYGAPSGPVYTDLITREYDEGSSSQQPVYKPSADGMVPYVDVTVRGLQSGVEYCTTLLSSSPVGTTSGIGFDTNAACAKAPGSAATFRVYLDDASGISNRVYAAVAKKGDLDKDKYVSGGKLVAADRAGVAVRTAKLSDLISWSNLKVADVGATKADLTYDYRFDASLKSRIAQMCLVTDISRGYTFDVPKNAIPQGFGGYNHTTYGCGSSSSSDTQDGEFSKVKTEKSQVDVGVGANHGDYRYDSYTKGTVTYTLQHYGSYNWYDFATDMGGKLSGTASATVSGLRANTKYGNWGPDKDYLSGFYFTTLGDMAAKGETHRTDPWSRVFSHLQVKFSDGSFYDPLGMDYDYSDADKVVNVPEFTTKASDVSKPSEPSKPSKPSEPSKPSAGSFTDVSKSTPHADDIAWLASSGISTGWKNASGRSEFRPALSVTRQDMAAFLYRLAGSPKFDESKARNPFVDVSKSTPHYKEILWLASTGVSTGWKTARGTEFRGMNTVVRQDMAAFLHRLADYQKAKPTLGKTVSFKDVSKSTPHADDIAWLARTGVTTGWKDGTFRGMNAVVRQDMAAFLHRMNANVLK